jgi:hypothetical protein
VPTPLRRSLRAILRTSRIAVCHCVPLIDPWRHP